MRENWAESSEISDLLKKSADILTNVKRHITTVETFPERVPALQNSNAQRR